MKIYDVFISYRRSDGLIIAETLYKYLTSKGLRVFFDKHEMIDGHYFTTQIETNLKIAPNYILVATDDVFKFRKKEDWVRKEIEVAIEEYESNPIERTLTVLVPESVTFPEKETLPQSVCNIADAQRITLPYGEDFTEPFYKALKAVTNINRRNLWFAAHRWLENSKQPGGRFASLNINESILPNASKNKIDQKSMPINVYSKENVSENRQSLLDAMGCNSNHLYLIGQGGIGKTTALMHIMNNAYVDKQYSEKAQIPLFVELSFAPDTYGALYEGGKSSFIRRSIFKQVRADRTIKQVTAKEVSDVDEVFSTFPYDVAVQPITDILSKTTPAPEYLLLLDGLNEVSSVTIEETGLSVVQMIMREIDLLISECPNVRVVLTSRSDESAIYNESISRLYLSGVEDSTIKDYLESYELSKAQIYKVLEDDNLCETLQIPLFLTMYASLSEYDEVSTQGEILKLFFNERRRNISVYTMQERLVQLEKNITDVASAVQKNRIDADMQNFILDFILPEIAWSLECNGEFYLSVRSIRKIVEPILVDTDDLAFCGEFGRDIFSKYRNGASAKMHTYKVAKKILERLGDDITEVTESIINCCVFALGIMQESNGKYGFVHQHIRDYFAALKNINTIRLSVYLYEEGEKELALECMNKAFKDKPVNYTVRRFMGEYLGEHRNKPFYADGKWNYGVPADKHDRNLIERALDIFRGCFSSEMGYGIYSIITIVTEIRKDLSGCDFNSLDLSLNNFYNKYLSHGNLRATFKNCIILGKNILPKGHSAPISTICFNPNQKEMLSVDVAGKVCIWDTKDFMLKTIINTHVAFFSNTHLTNPVYSHSGKRLALTFNDGTIGIYETVNYECLNKIKYKTDEASLITELIFDFDDNYLAFVTRHQNIEIYELTTNECVYSSSVERPAVAFSCDGKFIINYIEENKNLCAVYDISTKKYELIENNMFADNIKQMIFSPNKDEICLLFEKEFVIFDYRENIVICRNQIEKYGHAEFTRNGDFLIIQGSLSGYILTYDTKQYLNEKSFYNNWYDARAFCSSGMYCCGDQQGVLKVYDSNGMNLVNKIYGNNDSASIGKISKDESWLVVGFFDGSIHIWEVLENSDWGFKEIKHSRYIDFHKDKINALDFSFDGQHFLTASEDGIIVIWDIETFKIHKILFGHTDGVLDARFSVDGKKIISASRDGSVKIWQLETGKITSEFIHESHVSFASFTPNCKNIISESDCKVNVWDVETGHLIKTMQGSLIQCMNLDNEFYAFKPYGLKEKIEIYDSFLNKKCGELFAEGRNLYPVVYIGLDRSKKEIVGISENNESFYWDAENFIFKNSLWEDIGEYRNIYGEPNWGEVTVMNKQIMLIFDEDDIFIDTLPGLKLHGVDFTEINPRVRFTDREKEKLAMYGAIID